MFLVKALARLFGSAPRKSGVTLDDAPRAAIAAYELLSKGEISDAEALVRPFFERRSSSADVFLVQGLIHKARGELGASATCLRTATRLREGFAAAWSQLGSVLRDADELEEALSAFEEAASIESESAEIHQNIGITRYQLRDVAGAMESLGKALSLHPGMNEARFALAEALLAAGDFERGWAEYEHRPHVAAAMSRVRIPRWRAGLRPERIAVIAEQGLGDVLMFARLLPRLRESSSGLGVFVQPPLLDLMRESMLADEVRSLDEIEAAEQYDSYVPFMSLAQALAIQPQELDSNTPYLAVSAARRSAWHSRVGARDGRLRVGLAWAGNAAHTRDSDRSIPAAALMPLSRLDGIVFYSLQVGRRDLGCLTFPIVDFTHHLDNLADAAALITELDLVISVDSAIAHLAGGLGCPVWALCPYRADWRWEIAGRESPWYESARVFRPAKTAEWAPVISRLTSAFAALQASRQPAQPASDRL